MSSKLYNPRHAGLAALTAFGLTSLGSISLAAATPTESATTLHGKISADASSYWDDDDREADDYGADDDLDDDGILEHTEIDFRHYDIDRDGALSGGERTAYWKHTFNMGKLGTGLSPSDRDHLARIAYRFDTDGNGRLTRSERHAFARLIRTRRLFSRLDRNDDNQVTRREARGYRRSYYENGYYGDDDRHYGDDSYRRPNLPFFYDYDWSRFRSRSNNWLAARFDTLDRNDNGRISWYEVESHILFSLRRGTRP